MFLSFIYAVTCIRISLIHIAELYSIECIFYQLMYVWFVIPYEIKEQLFHFQKKKKKAPRFASLSLASGISTSHLWPPGNFGLMKTRWVYFYPSNCHGQILPGNVCIQVLLFYIRGSGISVSVCATLLLSSLQLCRHDIM